MLKEIEKIIATEGGYVLDLNDKGGETRYGISKRAYPDLDIKNLTKEQAAEIYERDYFKAVGADRFAYAPFRWKLTDIAVHSGVSRALEYLSELKSPRDTPEAVIELAGMQILHYIKIVAHDPTQSKYIHGWAIRGFDTGKELTQDA